VDAPAEGTRSEAKSASDGDAPCSVGTYDRRISTDPKLGVSSETRSSQRVLERAAGVSGSAWHFTPAVAPAAGPVHVLSEVMREVPSGTRQVGDVIVAASDGLFDNVFTDEVVSVVNTAMKENGGNGAFQANVAAAAALSKLAFANSTNDTYDSPYAQESTKEQQRMMEAQKEKVRDATGVRRSRWFHLPGASGVSVSLPRWTRPHRLLPATASASYVRAPLTKPIPLDPVARQVKSMPGPFGGMLGKVAGAAMSQVQPAKGGKQVGPFCRDLRQHLTPRGSAGGLPDRVYSRDERFFWNCLSRLTTALVGNLTYKLTAVASATSSHRKLAVPALSGHTQPCGGHVRALTGAPHLQFGIP
jgi:hypothetical protein